MGGRTLGSLSFMVLVVRSDVRETAVQVTVRLDVVQDAGEMISGMADYTLTFVKEESMSELR